jgi:hypothetical protein
MSEYFPDPSFHPPMAIVTLSFGCFCLKPMTFLYWAVFRRKKNIFFIIMFCRN